MAMWERVPEYGSGAWVKEQPSSTTGVSSGGCIFDQEEGTRRDVDWATKNACALPSVPNQTAPKGSRSMTRPRRWCGAG